MTVEERSFISRAPERIFLDTCTLQIIHDQGEFIYDGGRVQNPEKVRQRPHGIENLRALYNLCQRGMRMNPGFVISEQTMNEVMNRWDRSYAQYGWELFYWAAEAVYDPENEPTPEARDRATRLDEDQFEYLSDEDRAVIRDALLLGCDAFLTVEEKLTKQREHLQRELGLTVLRPYEYWDFLTPSHAPAHSSSAL